MAAYEPQSRRLFAEIVARPDLSVDLGRAALLVACEEYPELDIDRYVERLDALAASVVSSVTDRHPERILAALHRRLFEQEGFRGNQGDYYDPRNSFLNDVLDRRTGIPITLSAVYLEVARRAGLRAFGVGLPGHFVVRVALPQRDVLVDPFHDGAFLTEGDCQARVDRVFAGTLRLDASMLAPCGPKQILARLLRNLKAIYVETDDHARALAVVDLLLRIDPRSGDELRDRGLLHASLDCYARAAEDLEAYLALVPGAPDATDLLRRAVDMRQRAARLN